MDKIKEEEKNIRDENGLIGYNRLARLINTEKWVINEELVKNNFQVRDLEVLLRRIKRSKNKPEKKKNSGKFDKQWINRIKKRNWKYKWRRKKNWRCK